MANGTVWTEEDLAVVAAHPELRVADLQKLLPHRSVSALKNVKHNLGAYGNNKPRVTREVPRVKPAGGYIETVGAPLADDWECLSIWLKWQGYHAYRELSRDMKVGMFGIVTLFCTAKE